MADLALTDLAVTDHAVPDPAGPGLPVPDVLMPQASLLPAELPHPAPPAAGWVPSSPCGPGCLPADDGTSVRWPRLAARLAGLVVVLVGAALGAPLLGGQARRRWLRACSAAALRAAGVRLLVSDAARLTGGGGVLVVANHLSWIDVLAVGAVTPVRILAKREVRDWPVIGGLAARTGALFVDRAGLHALPATVTAMAGAMRAGATVAVFPEGTTWCGGAAGSFRRAAFQAAIDADVPVLPVAIVMSRSDGSRARSAAFVGEQTLCQSLCRVLRLPDLVCELTVVPAVPAGAVADRRELARRAGEAVASVTGVPHPPRREPAVERIVAPTAAAA